VGSGARPCAGLAPVGPGVRIAGHGPQRGCCSSPAPAQAPAGADRRGPPLRCAGAVYSAGFFERFFRDGHTLEVRTQGPCRAVVWCGVVWCGVVWCGVVWCGVVWCGVEWSGVEWSVVVQRPELHPWPGGWHALAHRCPPPPPLPISRPLRCSARGGSPGQGEGGEPAVAPRLQLVWLRWLAAHSHLPRPCPAPPRLAAIKRPAPPHPTLPCARAGVRGLRGGCGPAPAHQPGRRRAAQHVPLALQPDHDFPGGAARGPRGALLHVWGVSARAPPRLCQPARPVLRPGRGPAIPPGGPRPALWRRAWRG
jgi:hypothetical protein